MEVSDRTDDNLEETDQIIAYLQDQLLVTGSGWEEIMCVHLAFSFWGRKSLVLLGRGTLNRKIIEFSGSIKMKVITLGI
jgi:hypothetical protein